MHAVLLNLPVLIFRLEPFLSYAESIIQREIPDDPFPPGLSNIGISSASKVGPDGKRDGMTDSKANSKADSKVESKADRRSFKARMFNMTKVKRSRKWLKNVLLSDSSSEDEEGGGGGSSKRLRKLGKYFTFAGLFWAYTCEEKLLVLRAQKELVTLFLVFFIVP